MNLRPRLLAALLLGTMSLGLARATAIDPVDLPAYRGKVVLLDFWASWCGPCKESFPWMQRMQQRYGERGLVVVAVNVDHDRALAEQFLRAQDAHLNVVFDPQGQAAERYQVSAMPTSFYVGRDGAVRYTHLGFRAGEREQAERELAALLAETARN
jgi:thiol-disulfide isomerase/thioredoxin